MGNITAGIDLISRLKKFYDKKHEAYGLTVPLLTTSSGENLVNLLVMQYLLILV